jgi:hypothetical protein
MNNTREIVRKLVQLGWVEELNDLTIILAARDLDRHFNLDEDHSMLLWGSE